MYSYLIQHLSEQNPLINSTQKPAHQILVYASLILLIESGYLSKFFRPATKPLTRAIKLLHYSLQTTKKWQAYDIREISSMLDFELIKPSELVKIDDQDP